MYWSLVPLSRAGPFERKSRGVKQEAMGNLVHDLAWLQFERASYWLKQTLPKSYFVMGAAGTCKHYFRIISAQGLPNPATYKSQNS